jgi:transposase-like protein
MNVGKRPENALRSTKTVTIKFDPNKESVSGRYIRPRQRKRYNAYTDDEKAQVLALYALNAEVGQYKMARMLGIKQNQLSEWSNGKHISDEALAMADDYKERIKEKLQEILEKSIDAMPDKIDKANYWDLARTVGLTFDKLQLMEGKPTVINGAELPSSERSKIIYNMMANAKQRQIAAQVDNTVKIKSPSLETSDNDVKSDEWNSI